MSVSFCVKASNISIHKLMAIILCNRGFNVDEYEEIEEKKQGGLSAKEYKKKMEQEKEELNKNWRIWERNTTNWQTDIINSLMVKPNWNERTEKRLMR